MNDIGTVTRLAPVLHVLVVEDESHAVPVAKAFVAGGLKLLEATLRTPVALDVIAEMVKVVGAVVGAGASTVVNERQLGEAIAAGAPFIVSPGLTEKPPRVAIERGVPICRAPPALPISCLVSTSALPGSSSSRPFRPGAFLRSPRPSTNVDFTRLGVSLRLLRPIGSLSRKSFVSGAVGLRGAALRCNRSRTQRVFYETSRNAKRRAKSPFIERRRSMTARCPGTSVVDLLATQTEFNRKPFFAVVKCRSLPARQGSSP